MDVEQRLRACEGRWALSAVRRLDGGFRADVFASTTATGDEVVVKLAATPEEARAEAAALTGWRHTGAAVRLIDAELRWGALLLERIRPGTPLPAGDHPTATEVAADILIRLHRIVPPVSYPFPTLERVYPQSEAQARDDVAYERRTRGEPNRGRAGLDRLGAARAATRALCATTDRPVLLHGDFLDKNLLRAEHGYVAVDPLPRLGDPCADVGFFAAGHPPATAILRRASVIADRMGLNADRARRWAAIWTVHQDCQSWREDQQSLDELLDSDEFERLLLGSARS